MPPARARPRSLHARRRPERGASAVEYAGLIVLAALILGALGAVVPGSLQTGVQHAICTIFRQDGCGEAPTANGGGTAASRFAGGLVHGVSSVAAPPSGERADLPVRAPVLNLRYPGAGGPRRGGDNSSEHNTVVRDTKVLIEEKMGEYVTDGKVTIDCEAGGMKANCIPGGHKSGDGSPGRADIILTGKDKKTGKPVIYIWEVKPNTAEGRAEAVPQLERYVDKKQEQVGEGTEVRYGFGLPDRTGLSGNGDRVLNAWSEDGDPTRGGDQYRGIRFYGGKKRPESREKQPQEKPDPEPAPACGGQEPIAMQSVASCPDPVAPVLPEWPLPIPLPGPAPAPVPAV